LPGNFAAGNGAAVSADAPGMIPFEHPLQASSNENKHLKIARTIMEDSYMRNGKDEKMYSLAFQLLNDVSDALKKEGLTEVECWAMMFNVTQNLQANALGMGSESHRLTLEWQRESLDEFAGSARPH
jgi:hypothetical protein